MTVANAYGEEKLGVALQWAQSFSHARWKSSRELLYNIVQQYCTLGIYE